MRALVILILTPIIFSLMIAAGLYAAAWITVKIGEEIIIVQIAAFVIGFSAWPVLVHLMGWNED